MTVSTFGVPRQPSRVTAFLASLAGTLTLLGARAIAPHKASLRNLANIPLTVAGLGCVDTGVFQWSIALGWVVTGLSLVLLEHMIADDGEAL